MANDKKVFRVQFSEVSTFHVDIRAAGANEARSRVEQAVRDGDVVPEQDELSGEGFKFDTVFPIREQDADLDDHFEEATTVPTD